MQSANQRTPRGGSKLHGAAAARRRSSLADHWAVQPVNGLGGLCAMARGWALVAFAAASAARLTALPQPVRAEPPCARPADDMRAMHREHKRPVPTKPVAAPDAEPVMAGAPTAMVPITREYLRNFYAGFPDPYVTASARKALSRASALSAELGAAPDAAQVPHRIDECMYEARCACEQAAEHLSEPRHADAAGDLLTTRNRMQKFQCAQREKASGMVERFLPQDFRGRMFDAARQRSEQRNKEQVTALVDAGGSVRAKYDMLWAQQWARRESLASVGNATGIWRLLVRFVAGVPEPLLAFAQAINVPNGPTEELRVKFGATLEELVVFARSLRVLAEALETSEDGGREEREDALVMLQAAQALREEVERFCELLTEVVEKSPFFVSPDEIDAIMEKKATET